MSDTHIDCAPYCERLHCPCGKDALPGSESCSPDCARKATQLHRLGLAQRIEDQTFYRVEFGGRMLALRMRGQDLNALVFTVFDPTKLTFTEAS